MTAFAAAIDAMFRDPNIAVDALYGEDEAPVRAIQRAPDRSIVFGATALHAPTALIDVRVADIPAPAEGDPLSIGDSDYVVQGVPLRDPERLTWTLEVRPA